MARSRGRSLDLYKPPTKKSQRSIPKIYSLSLLAKLRKSRSRKLSRKSLHRSRSRKSRSRKY